MSEAAMSDELRVSTGGGRKSTITSDGIVLQVHPATIGPAREALEIWKGRTWQLRVTVTDEQEEAVDLTAASVTFGIAEHWDDTTPILSLSETDSEIVRGDSLNNLTITLSTTDTAAFDFVTAVYELAVEVDSKTISIMAGPVHLLGGIA